ncbi:MAG: hypothetical protein AAF518_13575 [Spirochaetota bacterium]
MHSTNNNRLQKFLQYILNDLFTLKNIQEFLLALSWATASVSFIIILSSQNLSSFPDRIIGVATLFGVDVFSRIKTYALVLITFPALFLAFLYFLLYMKRWSLQNYSKEFYFALTVFGYFTSFYLLCYAFVGDFTFQYLGYLFALQVLLLGMIWQGKHLHGLGWKKIHKELFIALVSLFSFLLLIYAKRFGIGKGEKLFSCFKISFLAVLLTTITTYAYTKLCKYIYHDNNRAFQVILFTCLPLLFFLFIPLLSAESYYLLNHYAIFVYDTTSLNTIYASLFLGLFILAHIYTKYRANKKFKLKPLRFFYNVYAPLFIIVLILSSSWRGVIDFQTGEGTELGNNIVAIQQFYSYSKLPILEVFPPHLISDIFGPFVYTLLYGYSPENIYDILAYHSDGWVLPTILFFYFIFKRYVSASFALLFTLLLPNTNIFLSHYYGIAYVTIVYFTSTFFYKNQKKAFAKWTLLWFLLGATALYRIDLGVATFLTVLAILIFCQGLQVWNYSWKTAIQSFLASTLFAGFMFTSLCLFRGINPIEKAGVIRTIMSLEGQSNSYPGLFGIYTPGFFIAYFLLPLSLLFLLITKTKHLLDKMSYRKEIVFFSISFFTIFYFATFPRALMRHGWLEENVQFIFSSGIVASVSFVYIYDSISKQTRFLISLLVSFAFFLLIYFCFPKRINFPDPKNAILNQGYDAIASLPYLKKSNKVIPRINLTTAGPNKYKPLLDLFRLTLKQEETFLIFHNKDFLYALADREMPSYMGQVPMGYSSDRMQKYYLQEIEKAKAPLLIFKHVDKSGWDAMDGVDNALRAYRIAEFFYRKYEPFVNAGSYAVWVEKKRKQEFAKIVQSYIEQNKLQLPEAFHQSFTMGKLPYIWANYDQKDVLKKMPELATPLPKNKAFTLTFNQSKEIAIADFSKKTGNYILIEATAPIGGQLQISYSDDPQTLGQNTFTFLLHKSKKVEKYLIRASSQRDWMVTAIRHIKILSQSNVLINRISILAGD